MLASLFFRPPVVDPKALEALVARCKATESDCLVVMVDGKVVLEKWFADAPGPIEAMSATKSVVNLAVGLLIREGRIKGVDQPVRDFYPSYTGGGKEKVTIRHLMEHSSGIEAKANTRDIYSSPDFVKNALEKPLSSPPGTRFFYNNRAANLLAGVVGKAAGVPLDVYVKRKLLTPLGIQDFGWSHDRAGNPHGMSGFQVRPADLAKIGWFAMSDKGGRLPKDWMARSTALSEVARRGGEACGWLWWPSTESSGVGLNDALFATWRAAGMRQNLIDVYATLKGKAYPNPPALYAAMRDAFKDYKGGDDDSNDYFTSGKAAPFTRLFSGPVRSYSAAGYLGQYLTVVPGKRLVAVRMRRAVDETDQERYARNFEDFHEMVERLVP